MTTAVHWMEQGNFSNVKGVGAGVYEFRIDFGPGYRIYFGKDGDRLVILLLRKGIGATISAENGKR
ncbi:MAG: hypothetical protein AB2813_12400 [Candidatus Sedimenticola endophacoides]